MIILLAREGQMCNQLLSLASVYALGLEYKNNVKCPVTDEELKSFFEFGAQQDDIEVSFYESKFSKLYIYVSKVLWKFIPFLGMKNYNKELTSEKLQVFCDRFTFFDADIVMKHINQIREYFAFKQDVINRCSKIIKDLDCKDQLLVGVHIRRGDYVEFEGGKWFYLDEKFAYWMCALAKDKNVKFLIASNEKVNAKFYIDKGLDVIQPGKSSIDDLCLLSLCDYIMGPPSTYSVWAAMVGNKKRCVLQDGNENYTWSDFKLTEKHMEDGDEFQ